MTALLITQWVLWIVSALGIASFVAQLHGTRRRLATDQRMRALLTRLESAITTVERKTATDPAEVEER